MARGLGAKARNNFGSVGAALLAGGIAVTVLAVGVMVWSWLTTPGQGGIQLTHEQQLAEGDRAMVFVVGWLLFIVGLVGAGVGLALRTVARRSSLNDE